jgi:DNA-binding NarL/FixJ family response regulator
MDKMEILKLALAHAPDPKSAMELAHEMEAFLKGPTPAPRWVAETITAMSEPQPKTPVKPANYRRSWTPEELARLLKLIQEGKTISQMAEIMGRSHNSIDTALDRLCRGEYKTPDPFFGDPVNADTFPGYKS